MQTSALLTLLPFLSAALALPAPHSVQVNPNNIHSTSGEKPPGEHGPLKRAVTTPVATPTSKPTSKSTPSSTASTTDVASLISALTDGGKYGSDDSDASVVEQIMSEVLKGSDDDNDDDDDEELLEELVVASLLSGDDDDDDDDDSTVEEAIIEALLSDDDDDNDDSDDALSELIGEAVVEEILEEEMLGSGSSGNEKASIGTGKESGKGSDAGLDSLLKGYRA